MAVMHPVDIENYNYTETEQEMYYALKRQLPDKFHVFYSIRWFETVDKKRVDSESDFLIFDPGFGFITMEVKGGVSIDVQDGVWTLTEGTENGAEKTRILKCSPFEQAEKSMRHFQNYFFEEFNQSFNGVYGFVVAFPRYVISQRLSNEAPRELVIDFSDMNNLQQKINEIFHYWKNKRNLRAPFSQDQKNRFLSAINKRIALSAAAGALIPLKEREFSRLNIVQDSIIDALYNYKQAFIIGGAGTGKTWIGMKKVIRAAKNNKKALFLCYSDELERYVKERLSNYSFIDCFTFEHLMKEVLRENYDKLFLQNNGHSLYFDALSNASIETKYDLIVVDEAQDFTVDMALSTRLLLRDQTDSELYVFYDKNQNIFSRDFDDGFAIEYPPFILKYNIRNTGSIYGFATEKTGLGTDTIANSLQGVEPEYAEFRTRVQTKKQLNNIINRLIQREYVPNKSIVILSDLTFERSILSGEVQIGAFKIADKSLDLLNDEEVCFRTTAEFKGLEADVVIYLMNTYTELPNDENMRQNQYVAYTRARYYLFILNTKSE